MSKQPRSDSRPDDSGFTLTEVVVAMGLLTIFMAIFTTVTLMMTNTTTKAQRISGAVSQANQALLTLDKSVRYASAITNSGVSSGGTWHVEFDTPTNSNGTILDVCTQLRINTSARQLQQRTWTVAGSTYASGSLTAWKPLASNIINGSVSGTAPADGAVDYRPFVTPTDPNNVAATTGFQRLTVTLVAAPTDTSTSLADPDANRATMTFAAINSLVSSTTSVCQQVALDSTS